MPLLLRSEHVQIGKKKVDRDRLLGIYNLLTLLGKVKTMYIIFLEYLFFIWLNIRT